MSYKDKTIYKVNDKYFVEVKVVGYILENNKTTYRILYNDEIIDAEETRLFTKAEWANL